MGARFSEETGIRVRHQDQVACMVCGAIVGVGGHIVEHLVDCISCVFCSFGLLGSDSTECCEQFVVNCSGIVEKGSDNILEVLKNPCFIEERAGVVVQEKSFLGTVYNFTVGGW